MSLLSAFKKLLPTQKPRRSKLLAHAADPRFEHPAYRDIPDDIRRVLSDPTLLRNPPYQEGYYGLISGEFCMREFQTRLMNKLKVSSGLSPEEYRLYLEPMLVGYAELVHLLPASENHHHNTPGGLLRHGLETACFMLDWMVLSKFDHELPPSQTSMRLRRWYTAGIIAALFHDAGKPLTDVRVTSFDGTKAWHMGRKTIHEWSIEHSLPRYFISWVRGRNGDHMGQTIAIMSRLISDEIQGWLIEGGEDIWQALIDATNDKPGPLTRAVKLADSRSVKADRERGSAGAVNASTGVPVQSLCVDAMRYLLDEGKWAFNQNGSRLWKTTQGIFLVWSTGSEDIISQVVKDKVGGFPRSESTLLAAMSQFELFEKNDDGSVIWFVAPHALAKHGKSPAIRCVKIKNPGDVFPFLHDGIETVSVTIGRDDQAKEYLTKADAKAREQANVAAEKTGQADLFAAPAGGGPGAAENPKKKNPPQQAPKERPGISLPPELAAKAEEIKAQASASASPAIAKDEDHGEAAEADEPPTTSSEPTDGTPRLGEISDDDLNQMLADIGMAHGQPLPQDTQSQGKISSEDQLAGDTSPDCDDDTIELPANFKLTLDDLLLKKPIPIRRGEKKKASEVEQPIAQEADPLDVPARFKSRFKPADRAFFSANSELASRILQVFAQTPPLREVRSRVFIPLGGKLCEDDLPALLDAGWIWQDFTSKGDEITRTVRGVTGFLGSKPLSGIFCRLTAAKWRPMSKETIPEAFKERGEELAQHLLDLKSAEAASLPGVYSISFYVRDKAIEATGASLEEIEAVLLYWMEAVKVSREKKYYFRLESEVPSS